MEILAQLGLFGGKVFITIFAIGALLILFFALLARARQQKPLLSVENLNEKYEHVEQALKEGILDEKARKAEQKAHKKLLKQRKTESRDQKRIFVIDFQGDIRASHVDNLREEVTSVLTIARPNRDEVVVRLESPGGMVSAYGLAAAQLVRLRDAGVHLTVCVDKVAASGGYMMACTANKIVVAPFAVLGSIGVIAQFPNFHRLLKKHDIDYEDLTAGEFKRPLSVLGEVTEKGRRKALEQMNDIHALFKSFIKTYRPQVDLDKVATGEYWFGPQAIERLLGDELMASDDYLFKQRKEAQIFKVEVQARKKWSEKLAENIASLALSTYSRIVLNPEI